MKSMRYVVICSVALLFIGNSIAATILVDVRDTGATAAGWNALTSPQNTGVKVADLVDDNGSFTSISLSITSGFGGGNNGNGTDGGLYPAVVSMANAYFNSGTPVFEFTGLDVDLLYDFTFFGARSGTGAETRETIYTVTGNTTIASDPLATYANLTDTVSVFNMHPDDTGRISVAVSRAVGNTSYGYLNAVVLESHEASAVPEASTLGMLCIGLGLIHLVRNRRFKGCFFEKA